MKLKDAVNDAIENRINSRRSAFLEAMQANDPEFAKAWEAVQSDQWERALGELYGELIANAHLGNAAIEKAFDSFELKYQNEEWYKAPKPMTGKAKAFILTNSVLPVLATTEAALYRAARKIVVQAAQDGR